ncbi:protein kinase domain-containing protein [Streptomyces abikoensis]|uniref:protein kinase domain-containing protein n=1 Tax=Streptomyces abikoensis TaxID=97398 RepID=UPI0033C11CB1
MSSQRGRDLMSLMKPLLPADPRVVGSYRLVARLGGGGMGQVYLGRSRGGRTVAVKLVRPELAGDPVFRRRFAQEVDAAGRVNGFYTAQVVEADTGADPPWLVTSYIPGPSLRDAVDRCGPLPAATVAVLGAGLAEGLGAIHGCDLVHRDLKPANVILAEDGPRVIDFGIARALDATSRVTQSGVIGTPPFMSPEQLQGREATMASDVFSLSAVLAYAATGRGPFGDGPTASVVYRVVHDEPDLLGVPPELAPLIAAGLAKAPGKRPGVREILDHCAAHVGTTTMWLPPAVTDLITEQAARTRALTTEVALPPPPSAPAAPVGEPPRQPRTVRARFSVVSGCDTLFMPTLPAGRWDGIRNVTVVRPRKRAGEAVALGDPLLEVVVDRDEYVITSPVRGVLRAMYHRPGESLRTGATIAVFRARTAPTPAVAAGRPPEKNGTPEKNGNRAAAVGPTPGGRHVRWRPSARHALIGSLTLALALAAMVPVSVESGLFEKGIRTARTGDCVAEEIKSTHTEWYTMPCLLMRARDSWNHDGSKHFFKVFHRIEAPAGKAIDDVCAQHVTDPAAGYRTTDWGDMALCVTLL